MKRNTRSILLCLLLIAVAIMAAGCGEQETPYEINDRENFTVSVKFDANGGNFTTNTPVIVDSYDPSSVKTNGEGKAQIALIPPESDARGKNKFQAVNNGYFLAGWYETCTVTEDSNGQKVYTYANKWDFETDRLEVDPNGTYSSATPVKTLYAAWVPLFKIEYCDLKTGKVLTSVDYDPTKEGDITLPVWDEATGALDMKNVPAREGFTFNAIYTDAEGTQLVTAEAIKHTGTVDPETAVATNSTMKLYVDWKEGKWFKITTAEQFIKNAVLDGCYEIMADLDFTGKFWPTTFMYGTFTGKLIGNGHTISGIELVQEDAGKMNSGIFGKLADTAEISDLKFSNVSFTIKGGARMAGAAFGLFAGAVDANAKITGLQIENAVLKIDGSLYPYNDNYSFGLAVGDDPANKISIAGITYEVINNDPAQIQVSVDDDGVIKVTPVE